MRMLLLKTVAPVGLLLLCAAAPTPAGAENPHLLEFLDAHCLDCHTGEFAEAGVELDRLSADVSGPAAFLTWSQVYQRVRTGEMPPEEAAQPESSDRIAFTQQLAAALTRADARRQHQQGRAKLRRLNRTEYQNTLRDVLALPRLRVLEMLPPDGDAHGFDKSSDALDVSPVHMAKWMDAVDYALAAAIAPAATKPSPETTRVELKGVENIKDISRGFYAQLKQGRVIPMSGLEIDPTLQTDNGDFAKRTRGGVHDPPPHFDGLAMFIHGESNLNMAIRPFRVRTAGRYKIRVHGFGVRNERGELVPSDRVETVGFYTDDRTLGYCDLQPYEPTTAEITAWLDAGEVIKPLVATSPYSVIRVGGTDGDAWKKNIGNGIAFQWFELEGPLYDRWPPESHQRLFADLPMTEADTSGQRNRQRDPNKPPEAQVRVESNHPQQDAERLIKRMVRRALRRPVTEKDFEVPLEIVRRKLATGVPFQDALLAAYRGVLCSPEVLLMQQDVGLLGDHALASRLAYFLWASPPDKTLRELADAGRLQDEDVLQQQVDRMLDDPKSKRFVAHFLDHWLELKNINLTQPDENLYPEYNPLLVDSMLGETRAFFGEMIRQNLSVDHLVESDFTICNQRLAELYGIEGVDGSYHRRVDVPEDSHRGGLLTQASVLKVTANGTTTSPVVRGAFVMTKFLGDPPPPPPPSIPAVEPDISGATTIREQLEAHRQIDQCAKCHRKIDPPGFALESYDVMGGFREQYRSLEKGDKIDDLYIRGGRPAPTRLALSVDASGRMPDGSQFAGIGQFREILLERREQLAKNLLRQLLTYATGAAPSFADRAEQETMLAAISEDNYGLRAMIHAVVQSDMFRRK